MAQAGLAYDSYWNITRRPIYSAALVLPFLLFYEIGLILLGSRVLNGGDALLLNLGAPFLRSVGVKVSLASLLVLLVAFFVWQFRAKGGWRIEPPVLLGMFVESMVYGLLLFLMLSYFVQYLPQSVVAGPLPFPAAAGRFFAKPGIEDFVLYCGAGVYEEFVFRVLLLGALLLICSKIVKMKPVPAAVCAVILSSLLFSGFHHFGIGAEKFAWGAFAQRSFAGAYFAIIYVNRSFGIAAASHALYDVFVGVNRLVD